MHELRMPPLGQTTDELKVLSWLKAENDHVSSGEEIVMIETDKANLAVESPFSRTLLKVVAKDDALVESGDLLAYIGAAGESIPSRIERPEPQGQPSSRAPVSNKVQQPTAPVTPPAVGKVLASPAARQMASANGIDLSRLQGTGLGGRIEVDDVRKEIR